MWFCVEIKKDSGFVSVAIGQDAPELDAFEIWKRRDEVEFSARSTPSPG